MPKFIPMLLAAATFIALSGPAAAVDEIVAERGWQRAAYAERDDCRVEVRGNGQIYRIAGAGLRPGEVVRFRLTNADVRPIEYRVVADGNGGWVKFYMPFLWNRAGGTVTVELESASCRLDLAFDWARQTGGYNSRLTSAGY
jgi:hypothetical protein